jgi:hypothetical protein
MKQKKENAQAGTARTPFLGHRLGEILGTMDLSCRPRINDRYLPRCGLVSGRIPYCCIS